MLGAARPVKWHASRRTTLRTASGSSPSAKRGHSRSTGAGISCSAPSGATTAIIHRVCPLVRRVPSPGAQTVSLFSIKTAAPGAGPAFQPAPLTPSRLMRRAQLRQSATCATTASIMLFSRRARTISAWPTVLSSLNRSSSICSLTRAAKNPILFKQQYKIQNVEDEPCTN